MKHHFIKAGHAGKVRLSIYCIVMAVCGPAFADQTVNLNGDAGGKRFDGIGAVSGGGATSVLLKDYPEPQRSQVLDLLFKPRFGASLSALLVEVPGDGNSTQGTEPSHMHSRGDENFYRGYEWWLMREARKRNPSITLDAVAWSCPAWVGNNNFWSEDMCNYYVQWIKGLKSKHGLVLDAIGCRNEKGVNEDFIKRFRAVLNASDLRAVKLHGFDNWGKGKFDWVKDMAKDPALKAAVDIVSNHTMSEIATPADVRAMIEEMGKPIWNTEEHIYKEGFDCEISLVQSFNKNFLESGVTRIVNWYLVASLYGIEPYPEAPAVMVAREPWSGYYYTRPVLWGYAHYGQFSQAGWQYLNGACGKLLGGGTYVTLKSTGADHSIIAETKDARATQKVTFHIGGGLSTGKLCVWRSNASEQFVKLDDITPRSGEFTVALEPMSIYSLSTTTGQRKGSFADIPASRPFPFPYYETFDGYKSAKAWGYLPHYTADISGVFEIADRPDRTGKCLRQGIAEKAQSWAPEWMPYTILGDKDWKDYEVSVDLYLESGGWAGVMGRVSDTGGGYGCNPKGYYLRLAADGTCSLYAATQPGGRGSRAQSAAGTLLATGKAANIAGKEWHNLKLQFSGSTLTAFVDKNRVLTATNTELASGMVGLVTGGENDARNTALFDDLIVNTVNGPTPKPSAFEQDASPIYGP